MRSFVRAAIVAAALSSASALHAQTLTLQDAIERAIDASPQGQAAAARQDVLSASRDQADTKPAPSIEVLAENLGIGGQDLRDQIQLTGTYNQRIERGGKRAARIALVEGDMDVARAEEAAPFQLVPRATFVTTKEQVTNVAPIFRLDSRRNICVVRGRDSLSLVK